MATCEEPQRPTQQNSVSIRNRLFKGVRLGLAHAYYSTMSAFGLQRLHDMLQGSATVRCTDSPVWLLGVQYGVLQGAGPAASGAEPSQSQGSLQELLADFSSRPWMTYRKGFEPLGELGCTSDVGWGCMLRTGQMLLAQALVHHRLGRSWRRRIATSSSSDGGGDGAAADADPELAPILQLFWDAPGQRHAFGLHSLCTQGAPHGVVAGEWLGPWVLCKTLEAVVNSSGQGVVVKVVAEPGGGAPQLFQEEVEALFTEQQAGGQGQQEAGGAGPGSSQRQQCGASTSGSSAAAPGVVVLLPLVLGVDKVNPAYLPQLMAALRWPQSLGIVGGRPGSSLYFLGHQGDDSLLYLDPHAVQDAALAEGCESTFHCTALRTMPAVNIDPSVAIGFYCRDVVELRDLCLRLQRLESSSKGCPILSVKAQRPPAWDAAGTAGIRDVETFSDEPEEQGSPHSQADGWELL